MPGYITHITENLKLGIDFYGIQVAQTGLLISSDSSVTVAGTRIPCASTSINITSNLLISGTEYQYERVDIHSYSNVTTIAKKISFAKINISSNLNLNVIAKKIAKTSTVISSSASITIIGKNIEKAITSVSGNLSSNISAKNIKKAAASISSSLTASGKGTEIIKANASVSGVVVTLAVLQEINLVKISINCLTPSLLINLIKFKSAGGTDTSNYQTLFVLDNSPLTNQGRTFSSDLSQVFIENKNWNNSKSRYYKRSDSSGRKSFTLSWTYLPNSRHDTVDRRHARDFLKSIAKDPDVHTLKMINDDSNDETPYTETEYQVFVKDYSETLLRRDLINGVYYWDCNMTLEEA